MSRFTVQQLKPGQRALHVFRVTSADMRAFAQLSGDHNPMHTDESFAVSRGFDGQVVYGGLLIAQISRLLGMDLPGANGIWCSLRLDFKKPLYVGEEAEVSAEVTNICESAGLVELRLQLKSQAQVLAQGSAEVVIVSR